MPPSSPTKRTKKSKSKKVLPSPGNSLSQSILTSLLTPPSSKSHTTPLPHITLPPNLSNLLHDLFNPSVCPEVITNALNPDDLVSERHKLNYLWRVICEGQGATSSQAKITGKKKTPSADSSSSSSGDKSESDSYGGMNVGAMAVFVLERMGVYWRKRSLADSESNHNDEDEDEDAPSHGVQAKAKVALSLYPAFVKNHWCNVYRELDRGTRFFRSMALKSLGLSSRPSPSSTVRNEICSGDLVSVESIAGVLFQSLLYRRLNNVKTWCFLFPNSSIPALPSNYDQLDSFNKEIVNKIKARKNKAKERGLGFFADCHIDSSGVEKYVEFVGGLVKVVKSNDKMVDGASKSSSSASSTIKKTKPSKKNPPPVNNNLLFNLAIHNIARTILLASTPLPSSSSSSVQPPPPPLLQTLTGKLCEIPGIGKFLSWQVACDVLETFGFTAACVNDAVTENNEEGQMTMKIKVDDNDVMVDKLEAASSISSSSSSSSSQVLPTPPPTPSQTNTTSTQISLYTSALTQNTWVKLGPGAISGLERLVLGTASSISNGRGSDLEGLCSRVPDLVVGSTSTSTSAITSVDSGRGNGSVNGRGGITRKRKMSEKLSQAEEVDEVLAVQSGERSGDFVRLARMYTAVLPLVIDIISKGSGSDEDCSLLFLPFDTSFKPDNNNTSVGGSDSKGLKGISIKNMEHVLCEFSKYCNLIDAQDTNKHSKTRVYSSDCGVDSGSKTGIGEGNVDQFELSVFHCYNDANSAPSRSSRDSARARSKAKAKISKAERDADAKNETKKGTRSCGGVCGISVWTDDSVVGGRLCDTCLDYICRDCIDKTHDGDQKGGESEGTKRLIYMCYGCSVLNGTRKFERSVGGDGMTVTTEKGVTVIDLSAKRTRSITTTSTSIPISFTLPPESSSSSSSSSSTSSSSANKEEKQKKARKRTVEPCNLKGESTGWVLVDLPAETKAKTKVKVEAKKNVIVGVKRGHDDDDDDDGDGMCTEVEQVDLEAKRVKIDDAAVEEVNADEMMMVVEMKEESKSKKEDDYIKSEKIVKKQIEGPKAQGEANELNYNKRTDTISTNTKTTNTTANVDITNPRPSKTLKEKEDLESTKFGCQDVWDPSNVELTASFFGGGHAISPDFSSSSSTSTSTSSGGKDSDGERLWKVENVFSSRLVKGCDVST